MRFGTFLSCRSIVSALSKAPIGSRRITTRPNKISLSLSLRQAKRLSLSLQKLQNTLLYFLSLFHFGDLGSNSNPFAFPCSEAGENRFLSSANSRERKKRERGRNVQIAQAQAGEIRREDRFQVLPLPRSPGIH